MHVALVLLTDEEGGCVDVHARQSGDHCRATEQQLRSDQDIGHEGEEQEDDVGCPAVANVDNLEVCMATRSVHLDLTGEDTELQSEGYESANVSLEAGFPVFSLAPLGFERSRRQRTRMDQQSRIYG